MIAIHCPCGNAYFHAATRYCVCPKCDHVYDLRPDLPMGERDDKMRQVNSYPLPVPAQLAIQMKREVENI